MSLKKDLESKKAELKQMTSLISQKEENGNEIEYSLNQVRAELINLRSEKQSNEGKLTKNVEELKEKLTK